MLCALISSLLFCIIYATGVQAEKIEGDLAEPLAAPDTDVPQWSNSDSNITEGSTGPTSTAATVPPTDETDTFGDRTCEPMLLKPGMSIVKPLSDVRMSLSISVAFFFKFRFEL